MLLCYTSDMTTAQHILSIAEAGNSIADTISFDENIFTHLNVLMGIEDALDQGRVTAAILDADNSLTSEINTKMDILRTKISDLIHQCDKEDYNRFIEARSRRLLTQFNY